MSRFSRRVVRSALPLLELPTDISGLSAHWQARDVNLANNASVSAWPARLGPDLDTNSNGTAPLFVKNVLNGHPGVKFSSGSMLGKIGGLNNFLTDVGGATVLVFARQTSFGTANTLFETTTPANDKRMSFAMAGTGSGYPRILGRRLDSDSSVTLGGNASGNNGYSPDFCSDVIKPHTFSTTWNYAAANCTFQNDGIIIKNNAWQTAGNSAATSPSSIWIGSSFGQPSESWSGYIFEVAIYQRALTLGEVARIHQHWAKKYGTVPRMVEIPPTLPFNLNLPAMAASDRKTIVNWFPPFPLRINNIDPGNFFPPYPSANDGDVYTNKDYYTKHYLNPDYTNGGNENYGPCAGFLRERPTKLGISASCTWRLEDLITECYRAKSRGIDIWGADILSINGSQNWNGVQCLAQASALTGMKLIPMMDCPGLLERYTASELAAHVKILDDHGSVYRDENGKIPVQLSIFNYGGYNRTNQKNLWHAFVYECSLLGLTVAIYPMPNGRWEDHYDDYKDIAAGWTSWGSAIYTNDQAASIANAQSSSFTGPRPYMVQARTQDTRPRSYNFWEAKNTTLLRTNWMNAINGVNTYGAAAIPYVHMITWNDYSENSLHSPNERQGWNWLDLESYYMQWYKMGTPPVIVRDAAYLVHRNQPANLDSTDGSVFTHPTSVKVTTASGPAAINTIEVISMMTAPATLVLQVGTTTYASVNVGAGLVVSSFDMGSNRGDVTATIKRGSATILTVNGVEPISDTPWRSDMNNLIASRVVEPM